MSKIVVLDYSIFVFRSIFSSKWNKSVPPEYIALSMMISALKKIGLSTDDEVIVARDGRGNWRKDLDPTYKADRKEKRDAEEAIDWDDLFERFNDLANQLDISTDWHFIQIPKIEADDIAAVICRKYTDKEIVLVSYDADWQQLLLYPNVKIFSILKKFGGVKGAYLVPPPNFNAYKLIAKKIEKEKTDNLINPILTEEDYERRKTLVNLLCLPPSVECAIIESLARISPKEEVLVDLFPFRSLRERMASVYENNLNVITYEQCCKKEEKKKLKKKLKKGVKNEVSSSVSEGVTIHAEDSEGRQHEGTVD